MVLIVSFDGFDRVFERFGTFLGGWLRTTKLLGLVLKAFLLGVPISF